MCRHARAGDRTTKRTSGNTVAPEEAWCSISAWVADAMGRSGSWDSSKAFSKLTDTRLMIRSAVAKREQPPVWATHTKKYFRQVELKPRYRRRTPRRIRILAMLRRQTE